MAFSRKLRARALAAAQRVAKVADAHAIARRGIVARRIRLGTDRDLRQVARDLRVVQWKVILESVGADRGRRRRAAGLRPRRTAWGCGGK